MIKTQATKFYLSTWHIKDYSEKQQYDVENNNNNNNNDNNNNIQMNELRSRSSNVQTVVK